MLCPFLVYIHLIHIKRNIYIFFSILLAVLCILFRRFQCVEFYVLYTRSLSITYIVYEGYVC